MRRTLMLRSRNSSAIPLVIPKDHIRRILCIKPRGIGDIVLSTIVLDNLASHFSGVRIDYLTEHFARGAVANNPLVRNILTMETREFPLSVAWRIRYGRYDLLLDLWSNPRSALLSFLSGVKYRVGFGYNGRRYAYNILATSERGHSYHSAEHNLELLKAIGVPIISKRIHYHCSPRLRDNAAEWLRQAGVNSHAVVGIIPSGGWPSKRCEASTWIAICRRIEQEYASTLLLLWGPGDEQDVQAIQSGVGARAVTAPPTSVESMAGFISHCSLVIANDSGPMHIAAALGIPTIGIFGPTDPNNHGPYSSQSAFVIKGDLHCIICNKLTCPYHHECMTELPVEDVLRKVRELAESKLLPR